jgi:hypothetical protein
MYSFCSKVQFFYPKNYGKDWIGKWERGEKLNPSSQCAGSGTVSFWASQIPIPDYLYRSGFGSFQQQAKKLVKNFDFSSFFTFYL